VIYYIAPNNKQSGMVILSRLAETVEVWGASSEFSHNPEIDWRKSPSPSHRYGN
jgi:hypothetical protein